MPDRVFKIWSNQHSSWWGPSEQGYTTLFEAAGLYTYEEATKIVDTATVQGRLRPSRYNHITGKSVPAWDEVIVKVVNYDPRTGAQ